MAGRVDRVFPTWLARGLAAGAGVVSVTACSLILDWGGYTGGAGSDGGGDGSTPVTCGTAPQQCTSVITTDGGWQGPLALYNAAGFPDACADDGGYTEYFVVDASVSCSPCSCALPTGLTCSTPVATFYASDAGCQAPCGQTPLPNNACVPTLPCGASFDIGPSLPVGGQCMPEGGQPTAPSPWHVAARACPAIPTLSEGSCIAGEVCLPIPSAPTAPRICIRHEGVETGCPEAGPYQYGPEVFYTDTSRFDDTRGCTSCTCGAPSASCHYLPIPSGLRYSDTICTTPSFQLLQVPTGCTDLQPMQALRLNVGAATQDFDAGTCTPGGGQPEGGVVPESTPTSFCCTAQAP